MVVDPEIGGGASAREPLDSRATPFAPLREQTAGRLLAPERQHEHAAARTDRLIVEANKGRRRQRRTKNLLTQRPLLVVATQKRFQVLDSLTATCVQAAYFWPAYPPS